MGKAVINVCYGGFGLSDEACKWLINHGYKECVSENPKDNTRNNPLYHKYFYDRSLPRHHPILIQCIEELGEKANGNFANLKIAEFEGDLYRIQEYDGMEWIETPNDINWINVNEL